VDSGARLAADAVLPPDEDDGLPDVMTLPAPLVGEADSRLPENMDPLFSMMRYLLLALDYCSLRKQANVASQ
jgi:hypothetical protein